MIYDIAIIGGGPAGMTAALYARRSGHSVLVLEKNGFGGQITHSPRVENYPGIPRMTGNEYADQLMGQIMDHGADIEFETVTGVKRTDGHFTVETEMTGAFEARAVILATGVRHRLLGLPNEAELTGSGISYCAVCDGDFFSDQTVCVVGGGNSALQDALLLSGKCQSVTILQDLPQLTAEQALIDQACQRSNIRILTGVRVTGFLSADGHLNGVEVTVNGAAQTIPCDGLFVAIGLVPENEMFRPLAELNEYGYFDADERCLTRTAGLFVAGDCRSKQIRQLTTAVADGAVAALAASRYLTAATT